MSTICLTVPGITNSSENHWQSRWEREWPEKFSRIEQVEWDTPNVDDWSAKIESDVQAVGPENVVLVAHSLGCTAVAYWAKHYGTVVKGALLVAPSDCETEKYRSMFCSEGFDPIPLDKLPFRSIVVASTNDEWVAFDRAEQFASAWGSEFVDVGEKGHINPGSGYGEWNEGLQLLERLG
ncbi:MAG TPA: alpha/beta fold hydrolase [Pyrinomonadaceae bacterium]|nr:alpha/beta fold hydrolase [Pyrinomonadaceae bacterium]